MDFIEETGVQWAQTAKCKKFRAIFATWRWTGLRSVTKSVHRLRIRETSRQSRLTPGSHQGSCACKTSARGSVSSRNSTWRHPASSPCCLHQPCVNESNQIPGTGTSFWSWTFAFSHGAVLQAARSVTQGHCGRTGDCVPQGSFEVASGQKSGAEGTVHKLHELRTAQEHGFLAVAEAYRVLKPLHRAKAWGG